MAASPSERSLAPKEHGAYGQLMLPLLTSLLCARPSSPALLFAAAAVCAFFAHEPLLVLLGHRGSRALREAGARARIRLVLLAGCSLIGAGIALALSGGNARLAVLVPFGGAVLVGLAIWQKLERTNWGEITAAATLSSACIPVAIASGVAPRLAVMAWGVWTLGFGLVTLALRRAIHGHKMTGRDGAVLGLLFLCACSFVACIPPAMRLAAVPLVGFALALFLLPPSPKRLRSIGWALMMSSLATGLLLVRAIHSSGA